MPNAQAGDRISIGQKMDSRTTNLLDRAFFARNSVNVARDLLGSKIVRSLNGEILSGTIVETEAYRGHQDSASHAFRGQTPRNLVMFGPITLDLRMILKALIFSIAKKG